MLKKLLPILIFSNGVYAASLEDITENINIGVEYAKYDYKEKVNNKEFMSLKGPLYGFNMGYSYYNDDYFFGFNGRFLAGKSRYNGRFLGDLDTPYSFNDVKNKIFESQILSGIKMNIFNLYTGAGYRLKTDRSSEVAYFPRKSKYLYVPIGIKIFPYGYDNKDAYLSLIPYFEYDILARGRQTSDLTRFLGSKFSVIQKKGYGIKSGITCRINQVEITPYLYYWNIKDSEKYVTAAYWFMEPANKTMEIGVKISFVF